jgi:hypothetical protein
MDLPRLPRYWCIGVRRRRRLGLWVTFRPCRPGRLRLRALAPDPGPELDLHLSTRRTLVLRLRSAPRRMPAISASWPEMKGR